MEPPWQGGQPAERSNLVDFSTEFPGQRDRLTAGLRLIMVIPQFIALFFVGIAAFVVLIIGWFGALVTGRLPDFAEEFLSGYLRWTIRVNAYLYFLTDDYPPFSLQREEQYGATLELPPPERLNPLAVLFRIFLVIPAWIVASVALNGLAVVSIVSWAMIVFTGRLPNPLYEATRTVIRYAARAGAYFAMLTPEYAWGLLGDGPTGEADGSTLSPGVRSPWVIRLSSNGRTLVIVMLVIGVIVFVFNRRY
jgi:hypothetical protein